MKKILLGTAVVTALLVVTFYTFNAYIYNQKQAPQVVSYKDAEYSIVGMSVQLTDGVSVLDTAPPSSSKITTRYFGNEYRTDLNNDGREDVVFY